MKKLLLIALSLIVALTASLGLTACGGSSLSMRAKYIQQLAQNVDKVPLGTEEATFKNGASAQVSASALAASTAQKEKTTPTAATFSAEEMVEMPVTPANFDNLSSYKFFIANDVAYVDNQVNEIKNIKDSVLKDIKQYDVWVDMLYPGGTCKYKVNYDINFDLLTVETLDVDGDNNKYSRLQSTYDANGNVVINYYDASYYENKIMHETTLKYIEDKIYTFHQIEFNYTDLGIDEEGEYNENHTLFETEQKEGGKQQTLYKCHLYYRNDNGTIGLNDGYCSVNMLKSYENFYVLYSSVKQNVTSSPRFEMRVFDLDEHLVYDTSITSGSYIAKVVFREITGFDKIMVGASGHSVTKDYVVVNGQPVDNTKFKVVTNQEGYDYQNGCWQYSPATYISGQISAIDTDMYTTLNTELQKYGMSFKDDGLRNIINTVNSEYFTIAQSWSAFNYTDFTDVSVEDFIATLSAYKVERVSKATIIGFNEQPCVDKTKQVRDTWEYKNFTLTEAVSISVDTTSGSIDLSSINISVEKKQIFIEGNQYKLTVCLTSGVHSIELAYVECTFNNQDMSFSGFNSCQPQLDSFNLGEEYTLCVYLAEKTGESYERMTNDITVNCTSFEEFSLSKTSNDMVQYLSYNCNGKLIIKADAKTVN